MELQKVSHGFPPKSTVMEPLQVSCEDSIMNFYSSNKNVYMPTLKCVLLLFHAYQHPTYERVCHRAIFSNNPMLTKSIDCFINMRPVAPVRNTGEKKVLM